MITSAPVHVWLPGRPDPVLAGKFRHDSTTRTSLFQYAKTYLEAGNPPLAPDMPLRVRAVRNTGSHGVFPLFLDAGPDTWGRHLLTRRLGRDVTEIEALTLCPTDGVGNIALGEITPERTRVLDIDEFRSILDTVEAGGMAASDLEEQVLDAVRNGTSLGGTKPKLTLTRAGVQYLAKFPGPGDRLWPPHIECAMLKLAATCGIRACEADVWRLPGGNHTALLVKRFDRITAAGDITRIGYVSAHALLSLDMNPATSADALPYGNDGFMPSELTNSYVSLAVDMARWCGDAQAHREERQELWRRIAFNALIRNLDDHSRNHGLLCHDMARQRWRLSPAFDLVPVAAPDREPALSMAYRYVPPTRRGSPPSAPRLVTRIDRDDLLAAAVDLYGYEAAEAAAYLAQAAARVAGLWREFMRDEGTPAAEIERFARTFEFAESLAG